MEDISDTGHNIQFLMLELKENTDGVSLIQEWNLRILVYAIIKFFENINGGDVYNFLFYSSFCKDYGFGVLPH